MRRTLMLLVAALCAVPAGLQAQSAGGDNDSLQAVVVLARHGVRAPIESETRSGVFNAQPWPKWPAEPGLLTPHGIEAVKRMGEFYRQRYGPLLKGNCQSVRAESTDTPRTIASAKAVLSAVVPGCEIEVHADLAQDPSTMDKAKLADAVDGRMANQPQWFERAFARPLANLHDVLTKCDGCRSVADFRTMMIDPGVQSSGIKTTPLPRDARKENAVTVGADFAENFLLQYVEGMPLEQVGWGRVSREKLDELMEMNTRYHDFMLRTPYYAQQAAGPLAEKIGRLLAGIDPDQPPSGDPQGVTLHPAKTTTEKFVYLSAHDANLTWIGGLLRMEWLVSDETLNATPPGSALVFELHRDTKTNADTVRVLFIAQTLDQIRNLTPLTGAEKPSIAPVYVPGCSGPGPEYACSVKNFARVVQEAP